MTPAKPYNPRHATAAAFNTRQVWAVPFSLATTQGILSSPEGTKMFQFPSFPPSGLCIQPAVPGHSPRRVSPFGYLRI